MSTLKDLLEDYLEERSGPIDTIRTLSGIFNPNHAISILALICAITRMEQGDLSKEDFRSLWMKDEKED